MWNQWDLSDIKQTLKKLGYTYVEHLNYLINLNRSIEDIWRDIHKSRRKGIKRAEKNGIFIKKIESELELDDCYHLIKETCKEVKIPFPDISLFKNAYRILSPNNMVDFYIALQNDTPVGTRVTLNYNGTIRDWYAGSKKHIPYVNEALVWHILKQNAGKQNIFDFGGAGHPEKPYGVREFKKRFGGKEVNYGRYEKIHSIKKKMILDTAFRLYKKMR